MKLDAHIYLEVRVSQPSMISRKQIIVESGQSEAFVSEGVWCWQKAGEKFGGYVGIDIPKRLCGVRLNASIQLAKALLNGAIDFCGGDDESETSLYRGHFIEFLELFGELSEEINEVILSNASENNQMTALPFQKEICNCFAEELLRKIFEELGDDVFSILVDESRDVSEKEQVAVVLRYVDKLGFVNERFIGLVQVMETSALSLKSAIDELFARHNLSFGRVRGQHILSVTSALCEALQRKDQDIMNAVELVKSTKEDLKSYRLEAEYVDPICRRRKTGITNRDHYVVNNFNTVLDMQIQELENRFSELAEMYPYDFNLDEIDKLMYELGHYITDVKEDERFANLNGVSDLAKMMVETRKHIDYPLVYRLIKLSLVLPVATASVERCFSSMNDVKADLCNYRTSDGYMNDSCICYIERELFQQVSVEDAMQRFQMMESRREQL
ncbi:uncharacterized protein LOC143629110 [Bidens hawaiensis]|uniref:uncharacterized protein LOC143629110 n=1 Tax=Bidens hawaiensis TaxID=980011 RepID=UPI00404ABFCF